LLRVLQEGEFTSVGGRAARRADVRIVAATHQDLRSLINVGRFREDLYYRLNVIPIDVPPLRERRDDIPLLAQHFLDLANLDKGKRVKGISPSALELLASYDWPGNVREMENLIERLVILGGEGEILADELPRQFHTPTVPAPSAPQLPPSGLSFRDVVDDFETDLILQALEQTHWNKNRAARLLGLNRTTLIEKIKKKGLAEPS